MRRMGLAVGAEGSGRPGRRCAVAAGPAVCLGRRWTLCSGRGRRVYPVTVPLILEPATPK
jgi:hypothetical protein